MIGSAYRQYMMFLAGKCQSGPLDNFLEKDVQLFQLTLHTALRIRDQWLVLPRCVLTLRQIEVTSRVFAMGKIGFAPCIMKDSRLKIMLFRKLS